MYLPALLISRKNAFHIAVLALGARFSPIMSEAVLSMFDAIAGRYDTLNHVLSLGRDVVWRRKAAALLPALDTKANILDLCGGTGDFCLALRNRGITSSCIIGDFSQPMLRLGRSKGLAAEFVAMDALNPPFPNRQFDAVLCGFGMRNLDDLESGIKNVRDLLKPGGVFLTLEFFRPSSVFTRFFYRVLAPIFIPLLGRTLGSRREAYEYLVKSVRRFRRVEEYAALCRASGFGKVQITSCDFGIAHAVLVVKEKE